MSSLDYRPFGRTGLQVSPLTLGCMMFGEKTGLDDSCRIVDRAIDAGINVLDTANVYARGRSEEFTGEALKRAGRRDAVILCTKVHGRMADDDPNMAGNSRRHIIQQCEASLRRLRTDYIDLYQIHRPQPEAAIDETLRALDDLVRAGKVRYIGCSTFAGWQLVDSLWCAKEHGLNRFVSEQPPYNLLDRRIERDLLPACRNYGLATLPWSPLAGGLLTGKYRRGVEVPAGARYANPNAIQARRFLDRAFDVIEPLAELAAAKSVTLSQYALAWVIRQPGVTSPIIGPRTAEQLEDNLAALDVEFTASELERIDEISPPGTHVSPFYEAAFGPSEYRW